jgi:tetratricopeptide (TPR) repeat protein
LIGREQLERGRYIAAVQSLETAIRLDPNQLGAHLLLAAVSFQTGRLDEAKSSLHNCIRAAPELAGLYLFRALVYGQDGNRALGAAREAPDRRVEAAYYFAAAEDDYGRSLALNVSPSFHYGLLVNRGGMYLQSGRLDLAAADLEAAIPLNPTHYAAYFQLFHVRRRQDRLEEAARALDRAIEREQGRPELFRARAELVSRPAGKDRDPLKDLTPDQRSAAIHDLEQAIRLEKSVSQKARDQAERGRLLFAAGQTDEALAAYEAALRLVPDDPRALHLRAFALLDLNRLDELLAACDQALARGPPSADLLEARGLARLERKDYGGAISDFTVGLTMVADSAPLHKHRGWSYVLSDAFRLALADFDAALAIDPELADAYSGRGLARVALGSWREALADADQAVRLATAARKQRALYNAAQVYAHALRYAADEVSRRGESALALHRQLRGRVSWLLRESAGQLPPQERGPFWRKVVASDPVLRPFLPGPG